MTKRDMFAELMQGVDDLKQSREGKLTLRTTTVGGKERKPDQSSVTLLKLIESHPETLELIAGL